MKEMLYLGGLLALISAVAALGLAFTYVITADKIAESRAADLKLGLKTVLPQANDFVDKKDGSYTGLSDKKEIGRCYNVSPKGYSGQISMLVGIDKSGNVTGVQILAMTETPGLGLNAQNRPFLDQFIGKTSKDKIKAKEDIKALTGATITTNAVSTGVRDALQKFKATRLP